MAELLNWEEALEAVDGSEEILIELAQLFLDEGPGMMQAIRAAIDAGDVRQLQRHAHSLKSSARIFRAEPVTQAAFKLEAMGRDGDLSQAEEAWAELGQEIRKLNEALADQLDRPSP